MNYMRHSTTNILQGTLKKWRIDTYANNAFHFKNIVWRSLTLTASNLFYHVHKVAVTQESVKTPGQTIDLELSVIDTHPGDRERTTVVGLHGNLGWAVDFESLIQQLSERNIRFIAPTFPGFQSSEVESWKLYHLDYTTNGRMSLIQQILRQTGVGSVSMLMCHSAGSWVGYKMAADSDQIKSLCLLNPVCARPHKSLRPQFLVHTVAWLLQRRALHFIFMPLLERAYAQLGFSGVKGGEHLMASQQIVSCQNFQDTKRHAAKIQERQLPLLFAYTLNDKIIEVPVSEEMLFRHLRVPRGLVTAVDSNQNQVQLSATSQDQGGEVAWFARGLQFERGGHIVHKAYSQIILDRILQLLAHVEGGHL